MHNRMPASFRGVIPALVLAATLGVFACHAGDERVVLESSRLRVEIDPASNGRIASITDKENGAEHLEPAVIREKVSSPLLPVAIVSNHGGVEDWFWKQHIAPKIAFRLTGQGEDPVGQWATVVGNVNGINVERRMTLLKSRPALQVDVTLQSEEPVEASYWMHMVVAGDKYLDKETGRGMVAGAFSRDSSPRQGRGMLALEQSGPQKVPIGFGDAALTPAGNWFARLASDGSVSLALVVEKGFGEGGGFFYTWQDIKDRVASLEAVWPVRKIGPLSSNAKSGRTEGVRLRYFLVLADETDPIRLGRLLGDYSARGRVQ